MKKLDVPDEFLEEPNIDDDYEDFDEDYEELDKSEEEVEEQTKYYIG